MTAIVTGQGLGLLNTSAGLLKGPGELGSSPQGTAGDKVVVDAANGNLVVQARDEWLVGLGPDVNVLRTYNSLSGAYDSSNLNLKNNVHQNWRQGFSRTVQLASGTVNSAGSTVVRIAEDGSQVTYTYNSTLAKYVGHDGAGANDTLAFANNQWTWTDGATNQQEIYDGANNGRLTQVMDTNGHKLTLAYTAGGLINKITSDNGETVTIEYTGNNITDVLTTYTDATGATGKTVTRVSYGYDGANGDRLHTVTVYLGTLASTATGLQQYTGSGSAYTTTYNYKSTNPTQLDSIVQDDGSELRFDYEGAAATSRVTSITDTKSGAVTTFQYGTGTTTVKDANGNFTTLTFDTTTKQLLSVSEPAVNSITPKTTYAYDANGNVTSITDARGGVSYYRYDANNNLIYEQDASGHVITRTYTDSSSGTKPNLLQTLTVYTATAAANQIPASGAQTTRYVYDAAGNLRYEVSAEGRTTINLYLGAPGLVTAKITVARNAYPVGSLPPTQAAVGNGVPQPATLSLTTMDNWLITGGIDATQAERTDYTYNARGQLKTSTTYQKLKTDGTGDTSLPVSQTQYVYDQSGNLLQTIDGEGNKTTVAYDGLNRVVWSTDGAGNTTQTSYNASANTITTTAANGLVTVQTFDKSGHLLTVARNGTSNFGTVSNAYDALGHLVKTTDATSQSTYYIYDAEGNQVGMISPNRELTEYIYNKAGQLIHTIAYAKQIPTAALSVAPASLTLAGIKGTPGFATDAANDRHTYKLYDQAGRLAKTIDGLGAVVEYRYDGRGELLQTTQYSNVLSSSQLDWLQKNMTANAGVMSDDTNIAVLASTNNDRIQYNVYSADGLLWGTIDGNKNISINTYNNAGRLIQTTRYANACSAWPADNVLPTIYDAVPSPAPTTAYVVRDAANDQKTFYYYNASGQRTAMVDAERYLTRYSYNKAGLLASERQYLNAYQGAEITSALDGNTCPTTVISAPATPNGTSYVVLNAQDKTTSYFYDADNRLQVKQVDLDENWTQYNYNKAGQLEESIYDVTGSARFVRSRYDQLGRLIAEMGTDGALALDALGGTALPSAIDQVWATYGTRYTYDNASRKTSTTDASGNTTLYFYDADGRIKQAVNALGEVTEFSYDAFGGALTEKRYGKRIDALTLSAMKAQGGGFSTASFLVNNTTLTLSSILQGLANADNDSLTTKVFDQRGQLTSISQAISALDVSSASMSYNAFGELYKDSHVWQSGFTLTNTHMYDYAGRQAQVLSQTVGAIRYSDIKRYDAFGRVKASSESQNPSKYTYYTYDRLGRQLSITDTLGAVSANTYDAYGRVLTTRDALNNLTTYTYDDVNRTITVVHGVNTSAAFTTTSYVDVFGHTVIVTDGRGNNTRYVYNADGILTGTQVEDAVGNVLTSSSSTLDKAQRVTTTTDANGVVTKFSYDAANRVVSKVIDPTPDQPDGKTHLNLTTTYLHDAKGQAIWVRDANNVWTHTEYDLKGEVVTITVDPSSVPSSTDEASFTLTANASANPLNLKTTYAYDSVGNKVLVTEGAGSAQPKVTQYSYDQWNRRIQEVVDPTPTVADGKTHLNLTTKYTYDKNDNLLSKTVVRDASTTPVTQDVTRYVYDSENQLVYTVDAAGGVTFNEYDANGRVTRTTAYANTVTIDATKLALAAADITGVLVKNASIDHTSVAVYNSVGQLAFSVDALNNVTERRYDASGNVVQVTKYAKALSAAPTAITSGSFVSFAAPVVTADATQDQTTQYVYDSANRVTWTLQYDYDSIAKANKIYVSQSSYDKNGNVTQTRRYATPLTGSYTLGSTPAVTKDDAKDQVTNTVYDAANRASFVIVAADATTSYVTQNTYDNLGHLKSSTRFAKALQGSYTNGVAPTVVGPTGTATGAFVQQSAATDTAKDATTKYDYDNAGRLLVTTDAEGNLNTRKYDGASRLTDVTLSAADGSNASTTHYSYDAAGRVTDEIKGYRADGSGPGKADYADTRYVLDGVGNRVKIIDPRGVDLAESDSDWAQTTRVSLGYAQKVANLGANDATALKALYTSTQKFDALGHVIQSTNALGKSTYTTYDAFGNAIQITDPNGNKGYFCFNQLNQATWNIDPLGYATQTTYDAFGQVSNIVKYVNAAVGSPTAPGQAPATNYADKAAATTAGATYYLIKDATNDATTSIAHDLLGRQTKITDAANGFETMVYDALGNKTSYTNKLGGVYSYVYDRKGNLTQETLPVGVYQYDSSNKPILGTDGKPKLNAVINTYTYDARGNRLSAIEAKGLAEQRTTTYRYDRLDRMVGQTGQTMAVYTTANGSGNVAPGVSKIYDARGNLIEVDTVIDANTTARALSYFDALNRKVADISPTGTLTTYTYNDGGDLLSVTVYSQTVALPSPVGATLPSATIPTNDTAARTTYYGYDRVGRQISTTIKSIEIGEINSTTGNYEVRVQDLVTGKTYDANGNVTSETDARGNTTWSYYDAVGNKVAKVDAEHYLTVWQYDAGGNLKNQKAYANQLPDGTAFATSKPADLVALVSVGTLRETGFVRDKLGRVLTQTVYGVNGYQIDSTTGIKSLQITTAATQTTPAASDASTKFQYDALGNVTQRTEATGEVLNWKFDAQGRQTESQGASFTDYQASAQTQRQTIDAEYNALGLQVRSIERGYTTVPTTAETQKGITAVAMPDRISITAYDVNGIQISQTDAVGNTTWLQHDAAGRITQKRISRQTADSAGLAAVVSSSDTYAKTDISTYTYDNVGRQLKQQTFCINGYNAVLPSTPTLDQMLQTVEVVYNAFGEITNKSTYGATQTAPNPAVWAKPTVWQETTTYDNAGRAIISNAGTGVTAGYMFDANGNSTLKIESTGVDISNFNIDSMLARSDLHLTASQYNKNNHQAASSAGINISPAENAPRPSLTTVYVSAQQNPNVVTAGTSSSVQMDGVDSQNISLGAIQTVSTSTYLSGTIRPTFSSFNSTQVSGGKFSTKIDIPIVAPELGDGDVVVYAQYSYYSNGAFWYTAASNKYTLPATATTFTFEDVVPTPNASKGPGVAYAMRPSFTVKKVTRYGEVPIATISAGDISVASVWVTNRYGNGGQYVWAYTNVLDYVIVGYDDLGNPVYLQDESGAYVSSPHHFNASAVSIEHRIHFNNLPSDTSSLVFSYRDPAGATNKWVNVPVSPMSTSSGAVSGWFALDWTLLPKAKVDFLCTAIASDGKVLLQQAGKFDATLSSPSVTMQKYLPASRISAILDQGGSINFLQLGNNSKTATIQVRSRTSSGAWPTIVANPLTAGAFGVGNMAGAFNFNPKSAPFNLAAGSGPYDYLITTFDKDSKPLTKAVGSFTVDDANSVSVGAPVLVANLPTTVHFQNLPLSSTQYVKLVYRASGTQSAWTVGSIANVSPGCYDWDAMNAAPDGSKSYPLDYELQLFDGAGKIISDLTGGVTVGATQTAGAPTSVLTNANAVVIAPAAIPGAPTTGKTLALYYRPAGTLVAFQQAPAALITSGVGKDGVTAQFTFDASNLVPAQSSTDYEYYYQLLDAGGAPISSSVLPTALTPARLHLVNAASAAPAAAKMVVLGFANPAQVAGTSQTYNAFGEVVSQIDANGNVTTFKYNTLGKLIEKDDAKVCVTAEDGTGSTTLVTPVTKYDYDLQGRLVATTDNLGYVTTQTWTAEGADGQSREWQTFNADFSATGGGGKTRNYYDAFGDLRAKNALVNSSTVTYSAAGLTTTYDYDANHRLIKLTKPQRLDAAGQPTREPYYGLQLKAGFERYYYDSVGNRIAHEDTPVVVEGSTDIRQDKTYYDALGRVILTETAQKRRTTYVYAWQAGVKGVTGSVVGGWGKTTYNEIKAADFDAGTAPGWLPNSTGDIYDIFGHQTFHGDLGYRWYDYTYNAAGWLIQQKQSNGNGYIVYDYYSDGKLKAITDKTSLTQTLYGYDANGNKTYEAYATMVNGFWNYYQQSTIAYDALGRITDIIDPQNRVKYEYDGVGNKRRVRSFIGSSTVADSDYWYTYDKMNRMSISMGKLVNGKITIGDKVSGNSAVLLTYDGLGNRASATYGYDGHTEYYSYTAEGYLQNTYSAGDYSAASLMAERYIDLVGQVTTYKERLTPGGAIKLTQRYAYDRDGKVTVSTNEQSDSDGKGTAVKSTTFNQFLSDGTLKRSNTNTDSTPAGGSTQSSSTETKYIYAWWDTAQQASITQTQSGIQQAGTSTFGFDVNGHVNYVDDNIGDRHMRYTNNAQGLIMRRDEIGAANSVNKFANYYYVNGQRYGESGNDLGTRRVDYAQAIATKPVSDRKAAYKSPRPITSNFDQNYQPINASYPGFTSTRFVVPSNQTTLADVACSVWGDATLWYLIAEANGLSSNTALTQGQSLVIPNKVTNIHNSWQTSKVYDATEALGDTAPTMPDPPPPAVDDEDGNCGGLGVIIQVVVQVAVQIVVTAYTGSPEAGAAAGNLAGQMVAIADGRQGHIHWKQVFDAAKHVDSIQSLKLALLTAGASELIDGAAPAADAAQNAQTANDAVDTANNANQAVSAWQATKDTAYAVAVATAKAAVTSAAGSLLGMTHFSWRDVAATGMTTGLSQAINGDSAPDSWGGFGRRMASGMLSGGINAAMHGQQVDWTGVAAYSLGNAIGEAGAPYAKRSGWAFRSAVMEFGSALGDAVVGAIVGGDQKKAPQWWQEPDQSKPLTQADIAGFLEGADDVRYSQGGRDWDAHVKANRLSPEALAKKNWDESVELMNAEQKMRDALDRQGDLEEQHKSADAYARQLKRDAARKAAAQSSPNDPATRDGSITVGDLAALNAAFDRRDAAVAARNKFVGPLPSYGGQGEMKATPYDWKTDSVVGKMTAGVFGDLYGATIGKLTRDDNLAVNPFTGRILSGKDEFDAQLGGVLLLAPGPKGVSGLKGLAGDVAKSGVGYRAFDNFLADGATKGTFATNAKLISHFESHGAEFGAASADDYLQIGRDIMQNGTKVQYPYKGEIRNGYVEFMGNTRKGETKFGFVGTNSDGAITTIHTESGKSFWKMLNGDSSIRNIAPAP